MVRDRKLCFLLVGLITVLFMLQAHLTLNSLSFKVSLAEIPRITDSTSGMTTNISRARHKIIILSYMRSGSTFCGDIMQAHPDVFYVYEPLLYLWDYYLPYKNPGNSIRQRTKHYWRKSKPFLPEPLEFIDYMFNCNLTTYNLEFLTNVIYSEDFTAVDCVTSWKPVNVVVNLTRNCADKVMKRCTQSKAVVQKVVRLTMAEADVYLRKDPAVRVIHLVRDPRGILLSRMHFNQKTRGEMHNNYTNICRRMWDDIRVSKDIAKEHWGNENRLGRILTIRYEDLAQNPMAMTAILYRFAQMELLPGIQKFVRSITSTETYTGNGKVSAKKTSRKYPFRTAYHWREELPFYLVREADQDCRKVLHEMGYVSYPTEERLRNLNIPAKLHSYGKGLMTPRFV